MFRLTALLCVSMFLAMLLGGQDRGQLRFGLMPQVQSAVVASEPVAAAPVVKVASFAPAKPVMEQATLVSAVETVAPAVAAPEAGRIMYISAVSVNVRQGPGKGHAVVERLTRGEAVLEVSTNEGWSLIRIEGDGVEGYVASRLLSE